MPTRPLILLADDEPHILLALEYLTRQLGEVKVLTATDGPTAVHLAIQHQPALILLDVMMPGMDGYAACTEIRNHWQQSPSPHDGQIWFLTARESNLDKTQSLEVGANRIINKPFDPDRLLNDISNALNIPSSIQA